MCCFSGGRGVVEYVAKTNIFARRAGGSRQFLVYSMNIAAKKPVAMILPLPVPPGSPDDALRFIDLSGYPTFFSEMATGFPPIHGGPKSFGPLAPRSAPPRPRLEVHKVGSFEASFVPTLGDFDRLDPRFRIDGAVWQALPQVHDYGFAVFKLIDVGRGLFRRKRTIHPMAFELPLRDPSRLFFPTLHIHDGAVHEKADFDHCLFYQGGKPRELGGLLVPMYSSQSKGPAASFMKVAETRGILDGSQFVFRQFLSGLDRNGDTFVDLS